MNDDALRVAYTAYLAAHPRAGRRGCPPAEALVDLVERSGGETDRLATLDHAMACEACRHEFELLRAIGAAGPKPALARWASPRWLAAAALLVVAAGVGIVLSQRPSGDAVFRAGRAVVTLVAPAESLDAAGPAVLVWRGTANAVEYQVELLGVAGDSVFAGRTRDTTTSVQAGALTAGQEYIWLVRALFADGSQAASAPSRFRVVQR